MIVYTGIYFLAARTATQCDRQLGASCRPSVRLSVCNAVHCGSQGRWKIWAKRVKSCTSVFLAGKFHKTHRKKTRGRKRERELFWDTENHACTGLLTVEHLRRSTSPVAVLGKIWGLAPHHLGGDNG